MLNKPAETTNCPSCKPSVVDEGIANAFPELAALGLRQQTLSVRDTHVDLQGSCTQKQTYPQLAQTGPQARRSDSAERLVPTTLPASTYAQHAGRAPRPMYNQVARGKHNNPMQYNILQQQAKARGKKKKQQELHSAKPMKRAL